MTRNELINYCIKYWQWFYKTSLGILEDYPCEYIDNRLGAHSLTYANDEEVLAAIHVDPINDKVYLFYRGFRFYFNCIEEQGRHYSYSDINDKVLDKFVAIVLYIANNIQLIFTRMTNEITLIKYVKKIAEL